MPSAKDLGTDTKHLGSSCRGTEHSVQSGPYCENMHQEEEEGKRKGLQLLPSSMALRSPTTRCSPQNTLLKEPHRFQVAFSHFTGESAT